MASTVQGGLPGKCEFILNANIINSFHEKLTFFMIFYASARSHVAFKTNIELGMDLQIHEKER